MAQRKERRTTHAKMFVVAVGKEDERKGQRGLRRRRKRRERLQRGAPIPRRIRYTPTRLHDRVYAVFHGFTCPWLLPSALARRRRSISADLSRFFFLLHTPPWRPSTDRRRERETMRPLRVGVHTYVVAGPCRYEFVPSELPLYPGNHINPFRPELPWRCCF